MNLQPIQQPRFEQSTRFFCAGPDVAGNSAVMQCETYVRSETGFADLDGPAFRAYYCPACAAALGRE